MGDVSVRLLGGFEATVDGVPVAARAWRLKKARELVKLLALAGGSRLHREQVLDVLWRDFPPDAALNNLHQAVHVARRVLGAEVILSEGELLRLVAEIDVDVFEHAAAAAERTETPASYRAALALYGGELLPENRYDDWAEARRDELAERAAALAEGLASFGPQAMRGSSLPAETSSFVGRGRELGELRALLRRTRLLTLSGPGGGGKTRLALQLARTLEEPPADGVAFVELDSVSDASAVAVAVSDALDVHAMPGQATAEALVDFVGPRRLLLVVDNCEHVLAGAAALLTALLRAAPGLVVVATSREPLRVPGEVVFRVPSLVIPDPGRVLAAETLRRYEAVELFVERAGAAQPGFDLDDGNAGDVARICFLLDGLPLALELAAGRVAALGPAEIAERLDDRFGLLRAGSQAPPTRQQTLAATLEWSHDLLEPPERVLLRRLGIFAGGFDLAAVESVCGAVLLDAGGIADLLGRLVDKSLVQVDDGGSPARRFRLLETVRLYTRERLDEAGETGALAQLHARWALERAAALRFSPRLDHEAANLRVALATLAASADSLRLCVELWPFWLRRIELDEARRHFDDALAAAPARNLLRVEGLLAATAIDLRSGAIPEGLARVEAAHALAAELDAPVHEWRALQLLAELRIVTDEPGIAGSHLAQALELARSRDLAAATAISTYTLGIVHWISRDLDRAERLLGEAVEHFNALSGSVRPILSLVNIDTFASAALSGWSGGRFAFEDTFQPFIEITCAAAVGYVLANQATIARARGNMERARALLDESVRRFDELDDDQGRASALVRIGHLELAAGRITPARTALTEALALRRQRNDRRGVGLALAGLGLVETAAGEHAAADAYLAEARDLFRRAGDRWGLATTLWRTADLAFARDDLDAAQSALEEARVVLERTRRERWIASTLTGLAEVARRRGEAERAAELLLDARARYASRDDALGIADVEERLRPLLSRR